jgi:hypothetical protein
VRQLRAAQSGPAVLQDPLVLLKLGPYREEDAAVLVVSIGDGDAQDTVVEAPHGVKGTYPQASAAKPSDPHKHSCMSGYSSRFTGRL